MAIDERTRHRLFLRLEAVLGEQDAEALMEHLPPVGWADVATKRDIDGLAALTKAEIDAVRVATKRDIDGLAAATKADIDAVRVATKADIEAFRGATEADIGAVRVATKRDMDALAAATKADIDAFRGATKADIDAFRGATEADIGAVRAEMEHGFRILRADMATDRAEILAVVSDRLRTQTAVLFTALIAGLGATAALARL